ncbi:hypothetical protein L226DRAFT_51492 [Lentinus tigrinus ALCF2SS1-7]|uniref:uncharacterized protein n=1 Tax=Lentinus tigrinus ALCF2SS1-7 TaxID=1328758 RepID=UPI0011661F62|nr:hypothetical protein L226DRAFT_51492 [Lentinus tigrinus ALCF2SS1-7]
MCFVRNFEHAGRRTQLLPLWLRLELRCRLTVPRIIRGRSSRARYLGVPRNIKIRHVRAVPQRSWSSRRGTLTYCNLLSYHSDVARILFNCAFLCLVTMLGGSRHDKNAQCLCARYRNLSAYPGCCHVPSASCHCLSSVLPVASTFDNSLLMYMSAMAFGVPCASSSCLPVSSQRMWEEETYVADPRGSSARAQRSACWQLE